MLAWPEDQLPLELCQFKDVFTLSTLFVDLGQECLDGLDGFLQVFLIRIVIISVLEYSTEKQRISTKTSGRFRQITVQLEFTGFGFPLCFLFEISAIQVPTTEHMAGIKRTTYIDKLLKSRVCPLFLFKLPLPKQLMRAILHKRLKFPYPLQKQIPNPLYYRLLLLPLCQPFG